MKTINLQVNWPNTIIAHDSDGQSCTIRRIRALMKSDEPSDSDECEVISLVKGDNEPQKGRTQWGKAFAGLQDMFNCSSLDNGWNDR